MEDAKTIVQKTLNGQRDHLAVEITVTNECNCNCEYCFECSHQNISNRDEELRQLDLLKRWCEEFDRSKYSSFGISFWGGEPMMNTRFLFEILDVTHKYDFVKYMMYTNGLLYDRFEEMSRQPFFDDIKNRFRIQLSYDGEPHHKLKRKTDSSIIIKTAKFLNSNGIDVSFKATLSLDSLSLLPEIWDSYNELNDIFGDVEYSPTLDQTDKNNTEEAFETWKNILPEMAKKEKQFILKHGRPLWSWFRKPGKMVCNLNSSAHMHCDGKLYVCHACPYTNRDGFVLGNTSTVEKLEDAVVSGIRPTLRHIKCVKCCAVYCAVCHVNEVSKCKDDENWVEQWTVAMVNNQDRCRYFKYFGMIYRSLLMSIIGRKVDENKMFKC